MLIFLGFLDMLYPMSVIHGETVKLNLTLKYTHTDLHCSTQMPPSFHIIIWNE